jgi:hypothetical protein
MEDEIDLFGRLSDRDMQIYNAELARNRKSAGIGYLLLVVLVQ